MNTSKRYISVLLAGTILGGSIVGSVAALPAGQIAIQAIMNLDKKISYQGQYLKDSKGVNFNSITYRGVEYVPTDVIIKSGVAVNKGEGNDKNIYIGSNGKELLLNSSKYLENNYSSGVYTIAKQELYFNSKLYKYGYHFNQDMQKNDSDRFYSNGGLSPTITLSRLQTNIVPSEFEGYLAIPEDITIFDKDYDSKTEQINLRDKLKVIIISITGNEETVIATEPIVPGEVKAVKVPFTGESICFRIGTVDSSSRAKYEYLDLFVLEPKFIK